MNDRGNGRQLFHKYENINALIMTWNSIEFCVRWIPSKTEPVFTKLARSLY